MKLLAEAGQLVPQPRVAAHLVLQLHLHAAHLLLQLLDVVVDLGDVGVVLELMEASLHHVLGVDLLYS